MAARQSLNAANISFPLQIVIGIVATAITIYASQAGLKKEQGDIRSDLRDIQTRLELGRDVSKAQSAAQDERLGALKASIDSTSIAMKSAIEAVSKKQELQALQIAELSDKITKLSATGRK